MSSSNRQIFIFIQIFHFFNFFTFFLRFFIIFLIKHNIFLNQIFYEGLNFECRYEFIDILRIFGHFYQIYS